MNRLALAARRIAAWLIPAPGYGRCSHCNLPWNHVEPHDLPYRLGRSLFFVCTWCWPRTNPEQRIAYLDHLIWAVWVLNPKSSVDDLDAVYEAVLPQLVGGPRPPSTCPGR